MKYKLPEGWKEVGLGEITSLNKSNYRRADNWNFVNYLDTGNITDGIIDEIKYIDLEIEKLPSRAKRKVARNDIVYSTVRPIQKHLGIIKKPMKNMLVSTGFTVMTLDEKKANPLYVYYYLNQNQLTQYLQSIAEQRVSTYPALNISDLEDLEINLPPIKEQKAIADTLSSLDNKIELNNKINENLEQQAQAIFKHWFIDFEFPDKNANPYKSSGGEMVESELGMIPKGWEVNPLDNFMDRIDNRGKTPPYEKEKTEFPLLDVGTLRGESRIVDYNKVSKYVSEETYKNWFRNGHPKNNDILISTVGSLAEMKLFIGDVGCIAQNVVAMRTDNISPFYLYEYLKFIKNDLISYDIGTVQPSIKITHIIKHPLILPGKDILNNFHNMAEKITSKIYNNNLENQRLSQLRDTLLPKLMSGELRIPLD